MTDGEARKELRKILDIPIFPNVNADPLDSVTSYLMDNDVVPVVRCENCRYCDCSVWDSMRGEEYTCQLGHTRFVDPHDFCSHGKRKGEAK